MAVLAGDALNTLAFQLLTGGSDDVPPEWKLEAAGLVAAAAGAPGMVSGQALDMGYQGREVGPEEIRAMHLLKTGAMIAVSTQSGALLAGASAAKQEKLRDYGWLLGLAFQIRDDILDITGEAAELGKSPGKDGEAGKATLPAAIGEQAAGEEARSLVDRALEKLETFDEKADPLRAVAGYVVARDR
jgi:geranylgeranyl diphosphate synthase type II